MMNRRQVLKNLGLGAGYMVAAPSVFSLLQSCKNEPGFEWEPVFLTPANGYALQQILEVIIPKTDTPGATDVNIAQFIDAYLNEVADEKEQDDFKAGANAFPINFKSNLNKSVEDGDPEDFEKAVKMYLGAEPEQREDFVKRLSATQDPEAPEETEVDTEATSYGYLDNVRNRAIWAWKNSEEVGENVLWYDPVPGTLIGCMEIGENGNNGKTMSL